MADEKLEASTAFASDALPEHKAEASWRSLQGGMASPYEQPAGLNMDQGEPASAANTSDPASSDTFGFLHPHDEGVGGGAAGATTANPREDNQKNVY